MSEHSIVVRDDKATPMFEVTLTFGEDGKCRLKVDGREHEFWAGAKAGPRRFVVPELLERAEPPLKLSRHAELIMSENR